MKKGIILITIVIGIFLAVVFLRYGTISPCGALKKRIKSQLMSSAITDISENPWERAGQGLGLALAGPMIDNMVDSMTPLQCIRALYRFEVDGENIFSNQIGGARREYRGKVYSTEQQEPEKPEWQQRTETSPIDDSSNVYLWIEAEQPISGWLEDEVNPVLYIRCKENKTNAFIILNMRPETEYGSYGAEYTYITLRFDDETAFKEKFIISTDGEAVFFPKHIPYIKRMLKHKRLLIEFTPFNASPQITTFNLEGLEERIGALREACHW